jgi:hypothetical protein
MNWGWKLVIVYLTFVAGILTLVFKAKGEKVDLVATDYYKQELAFGKRMDATKNSNELSTSVALNQTDGEIQLTFPAECIGKITEGTCTFYCPSDANNDYKTPILLDGNGMQTIETGTIKPSLYILKLAWNMNGKEYYSERSLTIK